MPKIKRKNITKTKSKAPREGLDLIDATYQRKVVQEPDLRRELKLLRHSKDVSALVVLDDAYMAAADAMMGIENQPRGQSVDLLEGEWNWLILKAWTVAEQLAGMQPSDYDQEQFAQTLFNASLEMGTGLGGAVLKAAMAVGTTK